MAMSQMPIVHAYERATRRRIAPFNHAVIIFYSTPRILSLAGVLLVTRATDCTFGGPDLKTFYVTTARETMTPEENS
jgi:hypothetical protein